MNTMQNQPKQIRKPESVNVEDNGRAGAFKRLDDLLCSVDTLTQSADMKLIDLMFYTEPLKEKRRLAFEAINFLAADNDVNASRQILRLQTSLMQEQQKNIQTDRENNALITSQKAQIAELQAQVRRLEQENAVLEVCDKDGAVSPPQS